MLFRFGIWRGAYLTPQGGTSEVPRGTSEVPRGSSEVPRGTSEVPSRSK